MYLNKTLLIGNLTRDPENRELENGSVTTFSIATNRIWKKDGEKQQATDYHNIVVFGAQAKPCAEYLKTGSQVLVEGRMQTRSWEGEDGKKNYRTEVVAENVQFGNKPKPKDEVHEDDDISPEDIDF